MNIRSIQCPSCGSNLNVESVNQSLIYCMYCGASVNIETNHNKGYDMELGRLDARAEKADEILAKIEKIQPVLIRNAKAQSTLRDTPSTIYKLKEDLRYQRLGGWGQYVLKPFGIGFGILFVGAIFVVALNSVLPKPLLYLLEFIVGGAPIYLPVIGLILKFKKAADISKMIKDYEAVLADAKKEYEETEAIIKSTAVVNIPPRFRPEIPLNYIIKGFKAREFISIEQALFKCEEQMQSGVIPDNYFPLDASEATPFR